MHDIVQEYDPAFNHEYGDVETDELHNTSSGTIDTRSHADQ